MEPTLLRYTITVDGPAADVRAVLDLAMAGDLIVKMVKDETAHPLDAADAWLNVFPDPQPTSTEPEVTIPLAPITAPPANSGRRKRMTGLDLYVGMRVKLRKTNSRTPPGVPLGMSGSVVEVTAAGPSRSSAIVSFDNGITGRVRGSDMRLLG